MVVNLQQYIHCKITTEIIEEKKILKSVFFTFHSKPIYLRL